MYACHVYSTLHYSIANLFASLAESQLEYAWLLGRFKKEV